MEPEAADSTVTSSAALAMLSGDGELVRRRVGIDDDTLLRRGREAADGGLNVILSRRERRRDEVAEASALTVTAAPVASFLISTNGVGEVGATRVENRSADRRGLLRVRALRKNGEECRGDT